MPPSVSWDELYSLSQCLSLSSLHRSRRLDNLPLSVVCPELNSTVVNVRFFSFGCHLITPDCKKAVLLLEELRLMPSWLMGLFSSRPHRASVGAWALTLMWFMSQSGTFWIFPKMKMTLKCVIQRDLLVLGLFLQSKHPVMTKSIWWRLNLTIYIAIRLFFALSWLSIVYWIDETRWIPHKSQRVVCPLTTPCIIY